MIEPGTWRARGCEGALGYTSKDSEQVGVDLVVIDGPHDGEHITWYGYFSDKTIESTIESLRLLGWEGSDFRKLDGIDKNEVRIVVEHETSDDGEVSARVRWINGAGGVHIKKRMDEGQLAAFANRMRGFVLAHDKSRGAGQPTNSGSGRKPAARDEVPPPPTDEDIPY